MPTDPITHIVPVNDASSTVLGYGARTKAGRPLWAELDWSASYKDGGVHLMNPQGGEYLHVRCKWDPEQDGPGRPTKKYRRWYRVRCRFFIGQKDRLGVVADVKVSKKRGRWYWIVSHKR